VFRRFLKNSEGQSIVEFSISLPILLLIIAGILEFSRLGGTLLMVNYGAREGARVAALGANDSTIVQQVKESTLLLDDSKLVVEILPETVRVSSENVSVTVKYPVDINIPVINKITGTPRWVTGNLTMRVE
jgi:Flp pilus assembly protein TadG